MSGDHIVPTLSSTETLSTPESGKGETLDDYWSAIEDLVNSSAFTPNTTDQPLEKAADIKQQVVFNFESFMQHCTEPLDPWDISCQDNNNNNWSEKPNEDSYLNAVLALHNQQLAVGDQHMVASAPVASTSDHQYSAASLQQSTNGLVKQSTNSLQQFTNDIQQSTNTLKQSVASNQRLPISSPQQTAINVERLLTSSRQKEQTVISQQQSISSQQQQISLLTPFTDSATYTVVQSHDHTMTSDQPILRSLLAPKLNSTAPRKSVHFSPPSESATATLSDPHADLMSRLGESSDAVMSRLGDSLMSQLTSGLSTIHSSLASRLTEGSQSLKSQSLTPQALTSQSLSSQALTPRALTSQSLTSQLANDSVSSLLKLSSGPLLLNPMKMESDEETGSPPRSVSMDNYFTPFYDYSGQPTTSELQQVKVDHTDAASELDLSAEQPSRLISDDELMSLSVRELNRRLASADKTEASIAKRRRRLLKNRGYAAICRTKRITVQRSLQEENDYLRQVLDAVIRDRDHIKKKHEDLKQAIRSAKKRQKQEKEGGEMN